MSWFQSILQSAKSIIIAQGEDLILERLPDPAPEAVIKDQDYVSIIVKSARINHVRRWMSKFYVCVYARAHYLQVDRGNVEYQTVVVPTLMKELDPRNLDKVIQIDKPILGPVPYIGGLSLELGLFSIKSTELAAPYIELLTSLAEKASVGFIPAMAFVEPLRQGISLLFGNPQQSELEIGCDKPWANLETGYWVLMLAPQSSVNVSSLKVDLNDGQLLDAQGNPLKSYSYIVFEVARSKRRDDWILIPELKAGWDAIAKAANAGQLDDAEQLLKHFVLTCRSSPDLVPADQQRLAQAAQAKLPDLQKNTVISAGAVIGHPLGELRDLSANEGVREKGVRQVDATAAAQPRHVNISFLDEKGQVVPRTRSLVVAQRYLVRINIAELRQDSLITNAPPFPSDLLPQSATGHWLEVVVSSDEFEVQSQKHSLFLPTHGPSWHCACEPGSAHDCIEKERAEFLLVAVSSPAPREEALLRVGVYFRNNLVQSIAVRTRMTKTAEEGRPASAVSEYTLSRGFTRLEAFEPVALSILTNASADGRTHRLVFNGEPQSAAAVTISDLQISKAVDDARISLRNLQIEEFGGKLGAKVQYRPKYDTTNRKTEAEFVEDLRALALYGRRLWQSLFARHQKERQLLREHLRGVSRTIQVSRIEGSTFVFPWSLVYDIPIETGAAEKLMTCKVVASLPEQSVETAVCPHEAGHDENTLCPFGFWGLRHVIEQPPSTSNDDLATRIAVADPRHMILGSSGDLRAECLAHGKVLNVNSPHLVVVDCETRSKLKAALTGADVDLIYFYCHGKYIVVPGMQDQEPYLEIGVGERVTPADITTWYEETFPEGRSGHTQPLVFMNGCHTTEISPESLTNFVDAFVGATASGVIGTEISMFEPIAREAGEQFWQHFLASEGQETVGTAMRKMKLSLLKKRNLMGLAYTAFCSSSLSIVGKETT